MSTEGPIVADPCARARARVSPSPAPVPGAAEGRRIVRELLRGSGAQAKLVLGGPDDEHEQQAERVAEAVMRRSDAELGVADPAQPACTACRATGRVTSDDEAIRPKLALGAIDDPLEQEAERNAHEALEEPPEESDVEGQDEDEDVLRPRRIRREGARSELSADFAARLGRVESSGAPLPATAREPMERAFGRDFGGVRIHTDAGAGELASSVGALAFTRGSHIVFGPRTFEPSTREGKHLLAHELAHVVQQHGTSSPPVMRSPGAATPARKQARRIGYLHFYEQSGRSFASVRFFDVAEDSIDLPDGVFRAELEQRGTKEILMVSGADGPRPIELTTFPAEARDHAAKAAFMRLQIVRPVEGAKASGVPQAPEKEGVYGEFDEQGVLALPLGAQVDPVTLPGGKPRGPGGEQRDEQGEQSAAKGGEGGERNDARTASGSKYGWLGILELPPGWIRALETAFEVMGEAKEYLAIKETIQRLRELYEHRDALVAAFSSGESLAEVLLGVEDNAAMDALGAWAVAGKKGTKGESAAGSDKRLEGVRAIASKVVRILEKLRKVLRPVFTTRAKFQELFEGVMETIAGLESIEELMDAGSDIEELGSKLSERTKQLVAQASTELGTKLQESVSGVAEGLKLWIEGFGDDDFITYEELARAVTGAALKFVPYPYKLGVKAASAIGLERLVADNLVSELIPSEVLLAINESIRSVAERLQPSIESALGGVAEVVTDIAGELATELSTQMEAAFAQPSRRRGAPEPAGWSLAHAEQAMHASTGAPLAPPVADELEQHLGLDVDRARVHTDAAAATATEALGVDAFTVGSHVYFAADRFQPHTTEGRRLLAHELTHVEQQRELASTGPLQADWKSLRRRAIAKFGKRVRVGLTLSRTGKKEDLERAARVRSWVESKLEKPVRKADFTSSPDVKVAYRLVHKKNKTSIRRTRRYLGLVPGLTLDRKQAKGDVIGKLELGILAKLESFDPKKRARAALRRSLGNCTQTDQAHHVIPLDLQDHPLIKLAIGSGQWNMNDGIDNGVCLDNSVHYGSHPNYTDAIEIELDKILAKAGGNWGAARQDLLDLVIDKRKWCKVQKEIK